MATKLSKTHYFVFTSLFLGICGSFIQQEFWTAKALAETALIVFSLSYLSAKYYSSKIIQKYQDYNYSPNKKSRLRDDVIVNSSIHIIMPISLSLLYASIVLLTLKYFPIASYKTIGNFINPIIDFNKHYIKYPVTLLAIVLAILTLTRYLSLTKYKSFKKTSKYITSPFKVAVTLTFFLAQDKGINNNLLEYHFNSKPVISEFVTLNSNSKADSKKNEEIEKALDEYVNYVIERLNNNYKSEDNKDTAQIKIPPNAVKLKSFIQEFPLVKNEVAENLKLNPSYNVGSNDKTFTDYHETVWSYTTEKTKSSNLYEEALKKEKSFFSDFLSIIADERKSIKKEVLTEDAEIIQKLMGDFWSEFIPVDKFTDYIPLHKIIKDKAVDLLNDKLINSLYTLLAKEKVTKDDMTKLNNYIDNVLTENYKSSIKSVRNKFKVLSTYYAELNKAATKSYFEELAKNADHSIITYEEGLTKRKYYLAKIKEQWLTEFDKEKNIDELKKLYPDRTEEELNNALDKYKESRIRKLDDKISEIDVALTEKQNLKNYEYIRDRFSAGGIFFGLPISNYNDVENPCSKIFYPLIPDCPSSILKEGIISLEVAGNNLVITTTNGKYVSESKITKNLLLDAYNYVYSTSTYPVLIDGFFDDKGKELFTYNKNITYDKDFTKLLFLADNFIFDVLQDSISDKETKMKFKDAVSAYNISRDEISLSRIYDEGYFITTNKNSNFSINSQLKFSVVSKNTLDNVTDKKYLEMSSISSLFNSNYIWLLNQYPYLNNLTKFASYQALFRTLRQDKVDISDLILKNRN